MTKLIPLASVKYELEHVPGAYSVDVGEYRTRLEEAIARIPVVEGRDGREALVFAWCAAAFGADHATSLPQRGIRLLEEAVEAAQAAGCDPAMAHKLIDYIYARPAGELRQELGGIGITLLALAAAAELSADDAERAELERILAKPLEHFTARNKVKNDAGFNVAAAKGHRS